MAFVTDLISMTEEAESPTAFFYWSAMAAIAAVVKNNVYINRYNIKHLYPNIYVLLHGGPGVGKGLPISIAKTLVTKVRNTKIIDGTNSIQGIITELQRAETRKDGTILKDAAAFICASEFVNIITEDPKAISILTDLHDSHFHVEGGWSKRLKEIRYDLKNISITILGGTNKTYFDQFFPKDSRGGGFLSRTVFVDERVRRSLNAAIRPPTKVLDENKLVTDLTEISKISGEFRWDERAMQEYESWYQSYYSSGVSDQIGLMERARDQVLKAAMLIALSELHDVVLTRRVIEESIAVCKQFIVSMRKATTGAGQSPMAVIIKQIIFTLIDMKDNEMSRKNLLARHWGDFDSFDLDRALATMTQSGLIIEQSRGKEMFYKLPEKVVTHFKEEGAI